MLPRRWLVALGVLIASAPPRHAGAQVSVAALGRAVLSSSAQSSAPPGPALRRAFHSDDQGRVSVLVEVPPGERHLPARLVRIAETIAAAEEPLEDLVALGEDHPDWRLSWAPPRHLLLDKAAGWTGARLAREATGQGGEGVIIGIVDAGVDLLHGDLRTPDGKTRVAWLIDFSKRPLGRQPVLESEYDCSAKVPCVILSRDDIDELMTADQAAELPVDSLGHGTHVASLAAGNGLSSPVPRYVGVAPEATLIVASVLRAGTQSIFDSDILRAVRFVFDRAQEMGMPAVVNLSLGSDFGPHDGSTALERELERWVGPKHPGRAIVVAAGNSGALLRVHAGSSVQQRGIHTQVHVPAGASARVPIVVAATGSEVGYVYVWISMRAGDRMSIGLEREGRRSWIDPVPPGWGAELQRNDVRATLLNGTGDPGESEVVRTDAAVLILEGSWNEPAEYALSFEGGGTAEMWLQCEGALGSGSGSEGALFTGAFKQGTITVPATSLGLVAVGATLNRVSWSDASGSKTKIASHGSIRDPDPDIVAYFSSAGPTATGWMKPDLIAPGAFLAGAMSSAADPRKHPTASFFDSPLCVPDEYCLVVDETHAITSGTSMAAPQVSGAIALLFQEDPTLTQAGALALLQAGARPPRGPVLFEQQVGPGELDIPGALTVHGATEVQIERVPSAEQSWIAVSNDFAYPDPRVPLTGVVQLRTPSGGPSDFSRTERLHLVAAPSIGAPSFERAAPGLWRFSIRVPEGTGGQSLAIGVDFDGERLMARTLPIAVDHWVATFGYSPRGGCALSSRPLGRGASAGLLFALLLLTGARASGRPVVLRARAPGPRAVEG
jgi:subtilisin family serine protease